MTLANKAIVMPGLTDTLVAFKEDVFKNMNCVKIGQIQSFDGTKKTARIQIVFRRVLPNDSIANYPVLVDCPVFTLQGGGGAIQMPIQSGDQCIVLFSDRNIDAWFKNGGMAAPLNARAHDIADGIALVGINALTSSLSNYEAGKLKILFNGADIEMASGIITIKNTMTTLLTLLDGLIDVIAALQVNGPIPLTAASITTLNAYKTTLATLLG